MTVVNQDQWRFYVTHFTTARLRHYLQAAEDDRETAIKLYQWNAAISMELWKALAHLEVALRNAIDRQLTARHNAKGRRGHWIFDDVRELGRDRGRGAARHAYPYADVAIAIDRVRRNAKAIDSGQVISELPFGFWHQLVSKRQMFLWPDVAAAFPHAPGRQQAAIGDRVERLRMLRNRIGHHPHVWALDLDGLYRDLLTLAGYVDPVLREWIDQETQVSLLLVVRPAV